jgi:hypothetical protein
LGKKDGIVMTEQTTGVSEGRAFPTLKEQLGEAKVIHGTALETFIAANQEVNLLRPEEHENDGVGYPLWLRVYWRKLHPEQPNSVAGPINDYPDVLERIDEWLTLNQDLGPNPSEWLDVARRGQKGESSGY